MPRKRRPDPPPLQTNDVPIAMVGTAAWAVALVVLLLIGLPEPDRWWLWVCAFGVGIGLFGVWYIPRLHRSRAAAEARRHSGGKGRREDNAETQDAKARPTEGQDTEGQDGEGSTQPPRRRWTVR